MPFYLRVYARLRHLRFLSLLPIGVLVALFFGHPLSMIFGGVIMVIVALALPFMLDEAIKDTRYTVELFPKRLFHRILAPGVAIFHTMLCYASYKYGFSFYETAAPLASLWKVSASVMWVSIGIFMIHTYMILERTYTHHKGTMR